MPRCDFCQPSPDGGVSIWHMATADGQAGQIGVSSAEFYVHDGITVILRTPKLPNDQRMHVDTLYCPMCGRRYGDG